MNSNNKYKISFVASEVVPYSKTGGLADVAGALPKFLSQSGADVKIFTPKYSEINTSKYDLEAVIFNDEMHVRVAGIPRRAKIYRHFLKDTSVEIYFIENEYYFNRDKIYTEDSDEDERFIFFQKAVIETIQRLNWVPNIIHCNDWQSSLIPILLKDNYSWDKLFSNTATILTIHNVGYQGIFNKESAKKAELSEKNFIRGGSAELNGNVNFLKAGVINSDLITTVSETYSKELLTPEFGHGLEKDLQNREKDIYGIINGVDYSIWNPEIDPNIPFRYSRNNLNGKKLNKKYLASELGLRFNKDIPIIGIISRLAIQKGFDIIEEVLDEILKQKVQIIVLGSGDKHYEKMFAKFKKKFPRKTSVYIGYNYELAHLIEAGADMFLMPSHYEPCGLNQIYSLKYGTVPIVRKTGGLADTVKDWDESLESGARDGTGFVFDDYESSLLLSTVERALSAFTNKTTWEKIIYNCMTSDFSWQKSAEKYIKIYDRAYKIKNGNK